MSQPPNSFRARPWTLPSQLLGPHLQSPCFMRSKGKHGISASTPTVFQGGPVTESLGDTSVALAHKSCCVIR